MPFFSSPSYSTDWNIVIKTFHIANAPNAIKAPNKYGIIDSFILAFSSALAIIILIPIILPTITATPIDTTINIFVNVFEEFNKLFPFILVSPVYVPKSFASPIISSGVCSAESFAKSRSGGSSFTPFSSSSCFS